MNCAEICFTCGLLTKLTQADQEATCCQRFINLLRSSEGLDSADIETESKLLREIKDIRDELQMIKLMFEDQQKVLIDVMGKLHIDCVRPIEEYIRKVSTL